MPFHVLSARRGCVTTSQRGRTLGGVTFRGNAASFGVTACKEIPETLLTRPPERVYNVDMNTATATQETDLMTHAAECATKLARVALRNGATEDEAVKVGMDVLVLWLQSNGTMTASAANGVAAGRGWACAQRRAG